MSGQGLETLIKWLKASYDKLVLVVVLFVLLVSVVLLGIFVGSEKRQLSGGGWRRPQAPPGIVRPVDISATHDAIHALQAPFQFESQARRMFAPEARTVCVKCGRPIPKDAVVCPYENCAAEQPRAAVEDPMRDTDGDRMPDAWERKYRLNPLADDSALDADGDGWNNLEECLAGNNPRDAGSHPPPETKLRWVSTSWQALPYKFESIQRPVADVAVFVIKNRRTGRDFYVGIGEPFEGWEVVEHHPKEAQIERPGLPPLTEDVSEIVIRKDKQTFRLTRGRQDDAGEWTAVIAFLADSSEHTVKKDGELRIKNYRYKIVDIQKNAVVVSRVPSAVKTNLPKLTETERAALANEPRE